MMTTTTRKQRKVVRQPPPPLPTWAELPFEVITEILLFLPVNSLLRFKSVSKAWRQLITDPDFAKLHHSRSIQSHPKHLLVLDRNGNGNNSKFSADLSKFDHVVVEIYSVRGIMQRHRCDKCSKRLVGEKYSNFLVGSSNGLICIFHQGKLALSNPSTRTHRMIPCLDLPSNYMLKVYVGFGYDPLSYDYKVMVIWCSFVESDLLTVHAVVYSLNSNSWREVPCPQSKVSRWSCFFGAEKLFFVNNAFHWLCVSVWGWTATIICFDIHNETYGEVPLPPTFGGDVRDLGVLRLARFEECLCAINQKENGVVDIWVMNGYGTWSKSYVMGVDGICRFDDVVCRIGTHEILLVDEDEGLVQYDTRDRSIHKVIPALSIKQTTIVQNIPTMLPINSNPSTKGKPPQEKAIDLAPFAFKSKFSVFN
ncbi:hypothetical protein Dimus_012484 [Dionaea muscipula]